MSAPAPLTGAQRAAVLLVALGVEPAAKVLAQLSDAAVEKISVEVARLRGVPAGVVEAVLERYTDETTGGDAAGTVGGGKSLVEAMLAGALDAERAERVLARVEAETERTAFELLATADTDRVAAYLAGEHPQTAAVVLRQLPAGKAADVLKTLGGPVRGEITYRLATMAAPAAEVLAEVEGALRAHLPALLDTTETVSGAQHVASILTTAGRRTSDELLGALAERSPDLAGRVKGYLFVFDDFARVSDRDLQRILAEVDQRDLALSLKGADEALGAKLLGNVSERVRGAIQEEMQFMGPVKVSEVEDAQQRVVERAQDLEAAGAVSLAAPVSAEAEPML